MNSQIKIQIIGSGLALATALGCVAYEKIAKSSSYFMVGILGSVAYVPFFIAARLFQSDVKCHPISKWWVLLYVASGCTGPLWYWLTRTKNIMTGAVFEIKYIAILALFSILIGEKSVTPYTVIGGLLAIGSVYFISK